MPIERQTVNRAQLNKNAVLPYNLRLADFEMAMQDVYDFFFDVNSYLLKNDLQRLDDMLRPANLSGTLSDMITDALAKHSRTLTVNLHHNGHPDLIPRDRYPNNAAKSAEDGVEVKSTRKKGAAVDTHGARSQTLTTFVYSVDNDRSKGAADRDPLTFREVYIATVTEADFRATSEARWAPELRPLTPPASPGSGSRARCTTTGQQQCRVAPRPERGGPSPPR